MFYPKPLFSGARVALIAPSGPVPAERLEPAIQSVRALGLEPAVFESCRTVRGYLAGDDRLRADDCNAAFADPDIDGVLCIRGGYGAQRLMDRIDFGRIARNPKVFCGYSDVTALHIMLNQTCGFVTFHTPMPSTEWYAGLDSFTSEGMRAVLFGTPQRELKNPDGIPLQTLVGGRAQGILTGGNLSLVASSLGTPYEIDTKGKILFLEDVDEEPYRVDRMLNQLKMSGKLRDCAGILLGWWTNCSAKNPEQSLTIGQVLEDYILPAGKPALAHLACGHSLPSLSLPMGAAVELDASAQTVMVLDAP